MRPAPPLRIVYGTGTRGVNGTFYKDDFSVGGARIVNFEFAVAYEGKGPPHGGVMGMGFDVSEADADGGSRPYYQYDSVLTTMFNEGIIKSRAFSLYLDDLRKQRKDLTYMKKN